MPMGVACTESTLNASIQPSRCGDADHREASLQHSHEQSEHSRSDNHALVRLLNANVVAFVGGATQLETLPAGAGVVCCTVALSLSMSRRGVGNMGAVAEDT